MNGHIKGYINGVIDGEFSGVIDGEMGAVVRARDTVEKMDWAEREESGEVPRIEGPLQEESGGQETDGEDIPEYDIDDGPEHDIDDTNDTEKADANVEKQGEVYHE